LKASRIRILVADDFEPWRRFISSELSKQAKLQIIGEVSDGLEAVQTAEELQPDLILLDIGLPSLNGIEACLRIRKTCPDSKILFISEHHSIDIAKEAIRIGGSGYVVKSAAGNDLLPGVTAVLEGNRFASPSLGGNVFSEMGESAARDSASDHVAGAFAPKNTESDCCHEVALYPNDESLVHGFASFAKVALNSGTPVIVIATEPHRAGIARRLRDEGLDVDGAVARGLFIEADAVEALSTFMQDGLPVAARVNAVAKQLIAQAETVLRDNSRIAICGELAPTLLAEGKSHAAMIVERHFDDIVKAHKLNLLCGYILGTFSLERRPRIVERICAEHSAVHMA